MKKDYDTLSQAMNGLRKEGYTEDFNLKQNSIYCPNKEIEVNANDFNIDKFYRFEGMSNPADSSILYAISSKKNNIKGVLVNAYSIYAENTSNEMMDKLNVR